MIKMVIIVLIIVQNGNDAGGNDCGTVNPALVKHLGIFFVKILNNNYSTIDFKSLQTDLVQEKNIFFK